MPRERKEYKRFPLRMPVKLDDALTYTSESTGIPKTTIIVSGLRKMLIQMEESGATDVMKEVLDA